MRCLTEALSSARLLWNPNPGLFEVQGSGRAYLTLGNDPSTPHALITLFEEDL